MKTKMRRSRKASALVALLLISWLDGSAAEGSIERGRYVVKIGGCNDCHTPGYGLSGGQVPESRWLVGDQLGWNGPWGTTYPSNLRLFFQNISESEWLKMARERQLRPPMPWFALRDMSNEDLSSLYRFIRALGPAGELAPAYLPPGVEPKGPASAFLNRRASRGRHLDRSMG